jgi:hypothetical protein
MALQVKEAITPVAQEPIANFLNCQETISYLCHLVDVHEGDAVSDVTVARIPSGTLWISMSL